MRIAVLVKQIPKFETMTLRADGRLLRDGLELEMNAYCRRAVSKAVEFASEAPNTEVVVVTLGPPTAEDCLREAIAWGTRHGVEAISGLLITDTAFAGSDTYATATAIAAALRAAGPFDLVLSGRNSIDADTGQVGPQVAQFLGFAFISAAKRLTIEPNGTLVAHCETDDGHTELFTSLPAVVSCAERLIDPCKVDPDDRAAVDSDRIHTITASQLGAGPWGQSLSPTRVGIVRVIETHRTRRCWPDDDLDTQITRVIDHLVAVESLTPTTRAPTHSPPVHIRAALAAPGTLPRVAVIAEPNRDRFNAEMLGAVSALVDTHIAVAALVPMGTGEHAGEPGSLSARLASVGADIVVRLAGSEIEADIAASIAQWSRTCDVRFLIAPSTTWGREVAARVAATLGAGLTGDAVELELDSAHHLVAWKPAFGGAMVAAIHCSSTPQMATVRAGVLRQGTPRPDRTFVTETVSCRSNSTVRIVARSRDDNLDTLADAHTIIAVGQGVAPTRYAELEPLRSLLSAEFGATRKVTDNGWLPRSRQIGITGRSVSPQLLISIGANGKFNHSVGFRNAHTVVAINPNREAPIFEVSDVGIVADWETAVPRFVAALVAYGLSGR